VTIKNLTVLPNDLNHSHEALINYIRPSESFREGTRKRIEQAWKKYLGNGNVEFPFPREKIDLDLINRFFQFAREADPLLSVQLLNLTFQNSAFHEKFVSYFQNDQVKEFKDFIKSGEFFNYFYTISSIKSELLAVAGIYGLPVKILPTIVQIQNSASGFSTRESNNLLKLLPLGKYGMDTALLHGLETFFEYTYNDAALAYWDSSQKKWAPFTFINFNYPTDSPNNPVNAFIQAGSLIADVIGTEAGKTPMYNTQDIPAMHLDLKPGYFAAFPLNTLRFEDATLPLYMEKDK
jgi:hypothetical protein